MIFLWEIIFIVIFSPKNITTEWWDYAFSSKSNVRICLAILTWNQRVSRHANGQTMKVDSLCKCC